MARQLCSSDETSQNRVLAHMVSSQLTPVAYIFRNAKSCISYRATQTNGGLQDGRGPPSARTGVEPLAIRVAMSNKNRSIIFFTSISFSRKTCTSLKFFYLGYVYSVESWIRCFDILTKNFSQAFSPADRTRVKESASGVFQSICLELPAQSAKSCNVGLRLQLAASCRGSIAL
jgi:hypothetical protein